MIVIGSDPHKRSYTCSAVVGGTGAQLGCETVPATAAGHRQLLVWARGVDAQRVWAIEDCRQGASWSAFFWLAASAWCGWRPS